MFNKGLGLVLLLTLTLLVTSCSLLATNCLAEEESYTITTYYPSPYGSYNELQTNKFVVGDANGDGSLTSADQPTRNGAIRLKPQSGDPGAWSAGAEGEIAYSSTKDTLYVNNGSTWVSQGGSGAAISLKCKWIKSVAADSYSSSSGTDSCTPPGCPSGWTDVGTGCAFSGPYSTSYRDRYGNTYGTYGYGGYCERWCYKQ